MKQKFCDKELKKFISKKKVVTMAEMITKFSLSPKSIQRTLKRLGYLSSCSHNGSFYTLSTLPIFNNEGVWVFKEVIFSKYGTIKNAILTKINESEIGIRSSEIGDLFNRGGKHLLSNMTTKGLIWGKRIEKKMYYFSIEEEKRTIQLENTQKSLTVSHELTEELRHQVVLFIISQLLETPHFTAENICNRVNSIDLTVSVDYVVEVMDSYKLKGLKKNSK